MTKTPRRSLSHVPFYRIGPLAIALLTTATTGTVQAKTTWPQLPPSELAGQTPTLDPEAAAEALDWKIEINDSELNDRRIITEYIRYKIYAPELAGEITRLSRVQSSPNLRRIDLEARLTSPNGQVREFGSDAVKSRTLARHRADGGLLGWLSTSGFEQQEKFLAVPGIDRGCILEYRITTTEVDPTPTTVLPLQRDAIPVRKLQVVWTTFPGLDSFRHRLFILNRLNGEAQENSDKGVVTFTAKDLPPVTPEPFLGPASDYMMAMIIGYESQFGVVSAAKKRVPSPGNVDPKLGPWALLSTAANWLDRNEAPTTSRIKKLTSEVTRGASNDTDKAAAIHRFVQQLCRDYRRRPELKEITRHEPDSIDEFVKLNDSPDLEVSSANFRYFALAMYQAAGLEAHTILLPDRELMRFDPQLVFNPFLSDRAIAVQIGGEWRFSSPENTDLLPFGLLPWQQEGQLGLLALDHQQQFIKVPPAPSNESLIATNGRFAVDAEGTLAGDCQRSFTGHTAVSLRRQLQQTEVAEQATLAREHFGLDTVAAEVTNITVTGIDDPMTRDNRW